MEVVLLFRQAILGLTFLALLAGCASYSGGGLEAGVASEANVREVMGQPAVRWTTPTGEVWAYPRGPLGVQTFLVHFDASGRLGLIEQVLDDGRFAKISTNMTHEEVLHLIGPPFQTIKFPRTEDTSWDYRYRDYWEQTALFSVIFDKAGLVKYTFKQREIGDGHSH
jgi:hypothetical protein